MIHIRVTQAIHHDLLLSQGRSNPIPPTGIALYKDSASRRVTPSSPRTEVQYLGIDPLVRAYLNPDFLGITSPNVPILPL
jgi:hypothetical protein